MRIIIRVFKRVNKYIGEKVIGLINDNLSDFSPSNKSGTCDPNKSGAQHHHSLILGSKFKYLKVDQLLLS